jgi:hypothetical protein
MRLRAFCIDSKGYHKEIELSWASCVAAGYTGRNQINVRAHIEELKKIGVPVPETIPAMYWFEPDRITTGNEISVIGEKTSGEVEFFLASDECGDLYMTVASDHTDRQLETVSVSKAKQACSKIIAPVFWQFSEIRSHWDKIQLKAEISTDGENFITYQEGVLGQILQPEYLMELARKDAPVADAPIAILSGTLPILVKDIMYGCAYRLVMEDPVLSRIIRKDYSVRVLPDRN